MKSFREHRSSPPRPQRGRLGAARRAAVWGVLGALGVIAIAWGASSYQQSLITRSAQEAMEIRVTAVEAAAEAEVARYLGLLTVVADGLETGGRVTGTRFAGLTEGLDGMGLDGATSIVFVAPPVADGAVADAQRRWRTRFGADLQLLANEAAAEHVFAVASTSLDGVAANRTGIDVTAAAAPFAALMESRRTGEPAVSDAYQLIIDQGLPPEERQTSFSLVAPVEVEGDFRGWVLIGLRGQDFLGHVLEVAGEGSVETVLVAGAADGTTMQVAAVDGPRRDDRGQARTRTLEVAQQEWTLLLESDLRSLVGPSRLMPRNTRIAGGIAALLVGSLIWVLASGRARSARRIEAATADLAAAEAISRQQASMLDALLETIEEVGVMVVDADGRFLVISRAARRILGIESDDDDPISPETWQRHFGIFHPDGTPVETAEMPLVRALRGESSDAVSMVLRNAARPTDTLVEVSGRPLALGAGRVGAMAVFRDVTEERLAQAELAGFAGVVAHDLRHPLTVIGGYISMLTDHCLPDLEGEPGLLAETATYLAKASAGAARMAELISDLLDYTTASNAEMTRRPVDLNALAAEVAAGHLEPVEGAGPAPYLHFGPLPTIEGDPDRLRQLFANLVGNAVKYVEPGSIPLLDVSAVELGSMVRLRFADRGIGIGPDARVDIFRPFVRAHTGTPEGMAYTGTGLGLAICHQVVVRHGGEISVSPHRGGGSVFTVDLPVHQGAAGADPRPTTGYATLTG